ncbi:LysR family transcriptional regulator [Phaeobacter sp. C3_T13_0]|uniref:LysR family transcriptional regulator n=1 Tax=Phaeobacter cretensis TaxID=3342641 RepID=UPI0039BCC75D
MPPDPLALDFTALRTLRLVYAHGSFSRAAETLGVTQSTISYTMTRLRDVFRDPLFVRQGSSMVATERCHEIAAQAEQLINQFETMTAQRKFDPGEASVEIGLSCNYYERVTILPHVIRTLRREAPGIKLKVISSSAQGKQQLLRSESDILIGPIKIEDTGYYKRSLLQEEYACVMDPSNPLAKDRLSIEQFVNAPQVVVNYGGNFRSKFLIVMEAAGHVPNTVLEIPSPANLPELLARTDMIATVPSRISQMFGSSVASVPCPFLAQFAIDLYWTARTHVSAPHMWLRSKIAEAASRITVEET